VTQFISTDEGPAVLTKRSEDSLIISSGKVKVYRRLYLHKADISHPYSAETEI
jgi:hypothetical protein